MVWVVPGVLDGGSASPSPEPHEGERSQEFGALAQVPFGEVFAHRRTQLEAVAAGAGREEKTLDILDRAFTDVTEGRVSDEALADFAGW